MSRRRAFARDLLVIQAARIVAGASETRPPENKVRRAIATLLNRALTDAREGRPHRAHASRTLAELGWTIADTEHRSGDVVQRLRCAPVTVGLVATLNDGRLDKTTWEHDLDALPRVTEQQVLATRVTRSVDAFEWRLTALMPEHSPWWLGDIVAKRSPDRTWVAKRSPDRTSAAEAPAVVCGYGYRSWREAFCVAVATTVPGIQVPDPWVR